MLKFCFYSKSKFRPPLFPLTLWVIMVLKAENTDQGLNLVAVKVLHPNPGPSVNSPKRDNTSMDADFKGVKRGTRRV